MYIYSNKLSALGSDKLEYNIYIYIHAYPISKLTDYHVLHGWFSKSAAVATNAPVNNTPHYPTPVLYRGIDWELTRVSPRG